MFLQGQKNPKDIFFPCKSVSRWVFEPVSSQIPVRSMVVWGWVLVRTLDSSRINFQEWHFYDKNQLWKCSRTNYRQITALSNKKNAYWESCRKCWYYLYRNELKSTLKILFLAYICELVGYFIFHNTNFFINSLMSLYL